MDNNHTSGQRSSAVGVSLLLFASFIWGTAFVAQSLGMDHLGPCTFNAVRSLIGSAALLPAAVIYGKIERRRAGEEAPRRQWRDLWKGGLFCGIFLAGASLLQQAGLQTVSSGKAGFLTALYIVLVPIVGSFLGRKPGKKAWVSIAIALVGTWLLSVQGESFGISAGELMMIGAALVFTFHFLVIDRFSPKVNGVALSCVQFFVAAVISGAAAFWLETPSFSNVRLSMGPLLYAGVLSSGVAYTLQIIAQKTVNPTSAALACSMESVFAALAGWAVLGDTLSPRELLGCALMFAAVILTQLPERRVRQEQVLRG